MQGRDARMGDEACKLGQLLCPPSSVAIIPHPHSTLDGVNVFFFKVGISETGSHVALDDLEKDSEVPICLPLPVHVLYHPDLKFPSPTLQEILKKNHSY